MRKTLHGTVAVFLLSGLLFQWVARWSPVVFSRLYPPGGRSGSTIVEDPVPIASPDEN